MAEKKSTEQGQSIDYDAPQAEIDKAKAASHDADKARLAEEHPDKAT